MTSLKVIKEAIERCMSVDVGKYTAAGNRAIGKMSLEKRELVKQGMALHKEEIQRRFSHAAEQSMVFTNFRELVNYLAPSDMDKLIWSVIITEEDAQKIHVTHRRFHVTEMEGLE